jgi:putative sugar O-methyltransferase
MSVQVPDDEALLGRMMSGLASCDELYKPTNYWRHYEQHLMPELKRQGLHDFRRRRDSVLTAFGATDLCPRGTIEVAPAIPAARRLSWALNYVVSLIPGISLTVWGSEASWFTKYFYFYVKAKFERLDLSLQACATSPHGNPEDLVEIEGALWSLAHLQYCSMFADVCSRVTLREEFVMCELGPGLGRNAEVMARLFPKATLILSDIPPQLYVANQYLKSVFGERVMTYDRAVAVNPECELPDSARGRIVILPTWRLPEWARVPVDVFWNSASFQEMEPHVVTNYLGLAARMRPCWVYINALPEGNYWGERYTGAGGTKSAVLDRYYTEGLGSTYELFTRYSTDYFLRDRDYVSYIFRPIAEGKSGRGPQRPPTRSRG